MHINSSGPYLVSCQYMTNILIFPQPAACPKLFGLLTNNILAHLL